MVDSALLSLPRTSTNQIDDISPVNLLQTLITTRHLFRVLLKHSRAFIACRLTCRRLEGFRMSAQRYERVCTLRPTVPLPRTPNPTTILNTDWLTHQVSESDQDDTPLTPTAPQHDTHRTPSSPPPSFRSHASSPSCRRLLESEDPIAIDAERTLNDTFDDGSDSEDGGAGEDRQRLIRSNDTPLAVTERPNSDERPALPRTVTTLPPSSTPAALGAALSAPTRRPTPFNPSRNDGVFANLDAKPERGEKLDEQPPVRPSATVRPSQR